MHSEEFKDNKAINVQAFGWDKLIIPQEARIKDILQAFSDKYDRKITKLFFQNSILYDESTQEDEQ